MVLSFEKFTLFMRLFLISEGLEESLAGVFAKKDSMLLTWLWLSYSYIIILTSSLIFKTSQQSPIYFLRRQKEILWFPYGTCFNLSYSMSYLNLCQYRQQWTLTLTSIRFVIFKLVYENGNEKDKKIFFLYAFTFMTLMFYWRIYLFFEA